MCLFCASKGVVSTVECGGAHKGKGEEKATQTIYFIYLFFKDILGGFFCPYFFDRIAEE